jgi:putative oxidoreductase
MTHDSVTAGRPAGRWAATLVWVLKGLLALAFLAAAAAKLSGQPMMVAEFGKIGFGQGFRYLTGVTEVIGSVLLLWPRTAFFGALVLLGVCSGAFLAQIGPLHGDIIHVVVLASLLLLAAWLSRPTWLGRAA